MSGGDGSLQLGSGEKVYVERSNRFAKDDVLLEAFVLVRVLVRRVLGPVLSACMIRFVE